MRLLIAAAVVFGMGFVAPGFAGPQTVVAMQSDVVEHGGGCRKNSPPGQCCHRDNRTGTVHCH